MGVDVSAEISSPRISFSHDLNDEATTTTTTIDSVPRKQDFINQRIDAFLLDSDFDFNSNNLVQEMLLSSADELFSDGKILPTQIKKLDERNIDQRQNPSPASPQKTVLTEKKQLKELLLMNIDDSDHDEKPATMSSKHFWQFKRSCSLNGDVAKNKGLIRASLQFLSRSNSTGSSTPNGPSKQTELIKEKENQEPRSLQKQKSLPGRKSPGSVSGSGLQKQNSLPSRSRTAPTTSAFHCYTNIANPSSTNATVKTHPPPLRKCGSYGNGARTGPVLNIPDPYISRATINLFGFGSLFCSGKVKSKKR